jgi:serine/threonine-protein kinase
VRRIGTGTSSEVFEAIDPRGGRRAVKVLRSVFSDDAHTVIRLEREAYALATLRHPNLVRVVDIGATSDGRPFLVMPLLVGETARERLAARGPMPSTVACATAVELLAGLDAAHSAGIVHRDVKPANIFLPLPDVTGPLRRCVVIDFGIAKVCSAPLGSLTESRILGTPRYLSPEQVLAGPVDARTDVYAVGLTLFELITGRSPFANLGTLDLLHAHLEISPPDLREIVDVTPELAHAVERAVAKPPGRRWPSARAFAAVLERAGAQELLHHRQSRRAREPKRHTSLPPGDNPPSFQRSIRARICM